MQYKKFIEEYEKLNKKDIEIRNEDTNKKDAESENELLNQSFTTSNNKQGVDVWRRTPRSDHLSNEFCGSSRKNLRDISN